MRVSISSEKQLLYSRRQSNIERFQTLNVEKLIILNNNALSPRSVPLLKFHGSLKIPRTSFSSTKRYNRGEWGENLFRLNSGEIVYTCRVKFHPFRVQASQLVYIHKCNFLQRQDNTGFLIKLEFFISFRSISSTNDDFPLLFFLLSNLQFSISRPPGTFPFSNEGWIRKGVANRGKQFGWLFAVARDGNWILCGEAILIDEGSVRSAWIQSKPKNFVLRHFSSVIL